jgi:hypothetical protein
LQNPFIKHLGSKIRSYFYPVYSNIVLASSLAKELESRLEHEERLVEKAWETIERLARELERVKT